MKRRLPVVAMVLLSAACAAAPARPGAGGANGGRAPQPLHPRPAPNVLLKTFTSTYGPGTVVKISDNGNVIGYASPSDVDHIDAGNVVEGYVVCYRDPNTSTPVTAYDVNFLASGFGTSTSSPSPLTVVRDTSDGVLRLTQTYKFNGKSRSLQITMTLQNISGLTVNNVGMRRQVDFDIDAGGTDGTGSFDNWFGASSGGVLAYNDSAGGPVLAPGDHGMLLRGLSFKQGSNSGGGPGGLATADIADVGCIASADPTPVGPVDDGAATENLPIFTLKPNGKFIIVLEYDAF